MRVAVAILIPSFAVAAPLEMVHQGRLVTPSGTTVDGAHDITVSLYASEGDTTPFWFDTFGTTLSDGYYSVRLGSDKPLVASDFTSRDEIWVGVTVDTDDELLPRDELASVPWAIGGGGGTVPVATAPPTPITGVAQLSLRNEPVPGDDAFNVLLLHSDTTNGSTTFTDSSPGARTITKNGTVDHATDHAKFGATAIDFRGGGNLSLADSADWDFPGDFTIDFWVWFDSCPYTFLVTHRNYGNTGGSIQIYTSSNAQSYLYFDAYNAGGSNLISLTSSAQVPFSSWHHVAVVRSGAEARMYLDGQVVAIDSSASGTISGDPAPLRLGDLQNYSGDAFDGLLDEVRISKGVARWTSDFTPPTRPYDASLTEPHLYLMDGDGNEHEIQFVP